MAGHRRLEARPLDERLRLGAVDALAARVDDVALDAADAVQVLLPAALDPVAADELGRVVALLLQLGHLRRAGLVHVADQVGGQLPVRVVAVRLVVDLDGAAQLEARLRHQAGAIAPLILEHHDRAARAPPARHRQALVEAGGLVVGQAEELDKASPHRRVEPARHHIDVEGRPVVGQRQPVAVQDLAAHRRQEALVDHIGARRLEVLLAARDLQLPQPADKDGEQKRHDSQHPRHPPRQLRRPRLPAARRAADQHQGAPVAVTG